MAKGRLERESNPMSGEKPGFIPQHDTTGNEDFEATSPKNPFPTKDSSLAEKLDQLKNIFEGSETKTKDVKITNYPDIQEVSDGAALNELQDMKQNVSATKKIQEKLISKTEDLLTNQKSMINVLQSDKLIFGVHWDKSSDPKMTRIDAAENLEADVGVDGELVKNDFDRMPIFNEITEVEDEYGNYFMRFPKFYIQKVVGKNHRMLRISKTRYPGFYLPYVFWDFENGKELDYYDHSKYVGSLDEDDKLESKPGKHPLVSKNIVEFRDYARKNNDKEADVQGYQQLDIHAQDIIQTLFQVEFATLNSQNIMRGFTSGNYTDNDTVTVSKKDTNEAITSNSTADKYDVGQPFAIGTSRGGSQIANKRLIISIDKYDDDNQAITFDGDPVDIEEGNFIYNIGWISGFSADIAASSGSIGSNSDGKHPCMYRGIENPWGSVYQWVDGINLDDHQTWIAKDAEDYASNVFASPYKKVGYKNRDSNGYVKYMGFDSKYPFIEVPVEGGGSSSTYYGDNYYQNTGQRVARVSGYWYNGLNAGLFFWHLNNTSSSRNVNAAGRLLRKTL